MSRPSFSPNRIQAAKAARRPALIHPFPRQLQAAIVLAALALVLLAGCTHTAPGDSIRPGTAATAEQPARSGPGFDEPLLILVSLDGFHPDYLERGLTPTLNRLAAEGTRARWLEPSFPSKTFPNHYTVVTGLVPDHHGIIDNTMLDPELGRFALRNRDAVSDPRWWGGEPIWNTARRQGLRSATMFWPGSEAPIGGHHPHYWLPYDGAMTIDERLDQLFQWLDLPGEQRPHLVTLYFEQVDTIGHRLGPNAPELREAIADQDRALAQLLDGLAQRDLLPGTNLIITSDHGMAALDPEHTVYLEDLIDPALIEHDQVEIVTLSEITAFNLAPDVPAAAIDHLLAADEGIECHRREHTPTHWRYGSHPRVADIVCLLEDGWRIRSRSLFANRPWAGSNNRGSHGYDPRLPSMRALFIGHGPAFTRGLEVPPFQNIHIYPMLARLLGIETAANDGDPQVTVNMHPPGVP